MTNEFDFDAHVRDPATAAALAADAARKPGAPVVALDDARRRRRGGGKGGGGPQWPDVGDHGAPRKSCANARVAIEHLGVSCRYDEFHDRVMIESADIANLSGSTIETAAHLLRIVMHERFAFDPGKDNVHDAVVQLAIRHRYDPIRYYLDGLVWDGTPRLDRWLVTYWGAVDTELHRSFGRLVLIAAVRRVRQPGAKFDQMLVVEGEEGTLKSGALKIMAGEGNFSDQTIIGRQDREQQELLRGVWIYEVADLGGMQRAQVEHIKAFLSRTHDRARPAYVQLSADFRNYRSIDIAQKICVEARGGAFDKQLDG
jgi:hypothetical protein